MTLHGQLIDRLLAAKPGTKTSGFGREVSAILRASCPTLGRTGITLIPDAFAVDWDNGVLMPYEVVITNPVDERKLQQTRQAQPCWPSGRPGASPGSGTTAASPPRPSSRPPGLRSGRGAPTPV